jgi:2-polyprenyl-6-methoxyphenol hydroxylase-like FAD-dependent oxidoreductase
LLKKYQRLGYDIGDQIILEEYNNLRKIDNTAYAFGTLAIEELFSMENNFVRSLTSSALKLFNQSDRIKRSIIHNATGEHYFNNL